MKNLDENNRKVLEKILKKEGVVLAYLFGSAAKENIGPLSDIDIAVFFGSNIKSKDYFDKELKLAVEIERQLRIDRIDIVNLKTAGSPLLKHNAVFGGKLIFSADKKLPFEVETKIMKEYEDTKHLREVQNRILKKQIKNGEFGKPLIPPFSKYLQKYANQ